MRASLRRSNIHLCFAWELWANPVYRARKVIKVQRAIVGATLEDVSISIDKEKN